MTTKPGFDAGLRRVKPAFPVISHKLAAKKWAPEGARRERDKDLLPGSNQPKAGTIDRATADSLVNAYGKVGNLVRNQVAYMALKQANPTMERITFLEAGTERPLLES